MRELVKVMAAALEECLERGMVLPFVLAVVSVNGSVLAMRYDQGDDGLEPTTLAENYGDSGMMQIPINMMITDQTGQAVRLTIGKGGVTYH